MPDALKTGLGGIDDSVKLVINGTIILIAEAWDVHEGVLSQPSTWSLSLGSRDLAASIIDKFGVGPKFKFQLYVGNALQQTGYVDGIMAEQAAGGATRVTLKGRDALAPLQDTYVKASIGANVSTYAELVWFALQQVGIVPTSQHYDPNDTSVLRSDNSANRNIKSGTQINAILPHRTVEQILADVGSSNGGITVGVTTTPPQAKLHETWHHFIRRHIDRAGLMLWAAADGGFVLAAPDGKQSPTYLLRRTTGQPLERARANVIAMRWEDDRTHRHSEAIVYGRGGGKAVGRVKSKGGFVDDEMVASGYTQPIVFRDANTKVPVEAAFFARRKIAEERRAGWKLEYTISGNTLPNFSNGGLSNAVVIPDTTIRVEDDELELIDTYYIESLDRRRGPATTTTLRLVRLTDLIFGSDED